MRKGGLGKGIRLQVPYIYVEPKICFKDGEVDKEVFDVLNDIWKNYDVNIRYLYVHPDHQRDTLIEEKALNFNMEETTESELLSHIRPESIVCFFGRKEVLPSNHKVYSRDEFVNNYSIILSNLYNRDNGTETVSRYRRRRG